MNRTKKLSVLFFIIACIITLVISTSSKLGHKTSLCESKIVESFMPWDSACFYSALFNKKNNLDDLLYEKYKLDKFTAKGGLAPGVLWYRSNFHRRYHDVFDVPVETLDKYHWAYQLAQPHEIKELFRHMEFMRTTQSKHHAQSLLNQYCDLYLDNTRNNFLGFAGIREGHQYAELDYDLAHCAAYISDHQRNLSSQPL